MPPYERSRHARRHPKTCPVCGVDFMGRKNQVYCSYECSKKAASSRKRKRAQYNSEEQAQKRREYLEGINRAARCAVAGLDCDQRQTLAYALLSVYEGQKLYFCQRHNNNATEQRERSSSVNARIAVAHVGTAQRKRLAAMLAEVV